MLLSCVAEKHIEEKEYGLPLSQDDDRVRAAARERVRLLRSIMRERGINGYVVTRRDDFAWLTCGGENSVMLKNELGTAHILITMDRQYLLAYTMDADRVLDEQTPGQGYEAVLANWYDGDPREKAFRLVKGRIASDSGYPGMETLPIGRLHGGLHGVELDRCRWLAAQTDALFTALAGSISAGMTEEGIARLFHSALVYNGIAPEVLITGSEGRTEKYYHALPSGKHAHRHILVHSASSRWGLHANVNRLMCFGAPDGRTLEYHRAAATVHANVLSVLEPGIKYREIFELEKRCYAECGFPDEWKRHYQGGETGYVVGDAELCFTDGAVPFNKAFDWFLTVGGIQTEELSMVTENGTELASMTGSWPRLAVNTRRGEVEVPDIMIV